MATPFAQYMCTTSNAQTHFHACFQSSSLTSSKHISLFSSSNVHYVLHSTEKEQITDTEQVICVNLNLPLFFILLLLFSSLESHSENNI